VLPRGADPPPGGGWARAATLMGALRTTLAPSTMRARSSVVNVAQMAQREAERVQLVCLVTLTLIAVRVLRGGGAGAFSNGERLRFCGGVRKSTKGCVVARAAPRSAGAGAGAHAARCALRAASHRARPRGARATPRPPSRCVPSRLLRAARAQTKAQNAPLTPSRAP
jgi:hypothetical protein